MSEFDFLFEGEAPVEVEAPPKKPRKKSKGKQHLPMRPIPWRKPTQDGTKQRTHNRGVRFHSRGRLRRPEWNMSRLKTRWTLRSGEAILGTVSKLNTEWGVKLYQWRVNATGEESECLDVRAARRAVEKRTLTGPWAHLYNPRGGGIK